PGETLSLGRKVSPKTTDEGAVTLIRLALSATFSRKEKVKPLFLLRDIEVGQRPRESLGRHGEGLRERRVRMNGEADVFGFGAHLDRQCRLGYKITSVGPDDAAADQPLGFFIPQGLGHALVAAERERAPTCRPRKDGLAVFDALGFGFGLGQARPGD